MNTNEFTIDLKESWFPPEPEKTIVLEGGYKHTVFVSDASRIQPNDIVIAYNVTMFVVTDKYIVEDLFENFQVLKLRFMDNTSGLMWNAGDYLEPGVELKLLASSHAEK